MVLIVERNHETIGIDFVGYPERFAPAFDLANCHMFSRAGLRIFPLSFSAWKRNRERCLRGIESFL
ncbi:MAG: hypothetical protein CMO80_02360 [Verrucomicrobiales bacterium]|nr:hypothetical protein [Verrucomicrobiales bacterium]